MLRIHQSARFTGSASSHTWPWILILPMILCLLPGAARGAINVSESHLHGNETVYGLNAATAPIPYLNEQDIILWTWGETDPSLYCDVRFTARGVSSLSSTIDLVNDGTVNVNAVGGNVTSTSSADAGVRGHGLYALDDVSNSGNIDVAITGGTAEAGDGGADTSINGHGIWTWDAGSNSGNINVTIAGGTAETDALRADASIHGAGLFAFKEVNNSGNIGVIVTGGTAAANDGVADASAVGFGLCLDEETKIYLAGSSSGTLLDASGATSDRQLTNTGDIAVTVTAGAAAGGDARAYVDAYGIYAREADVVNLGGIRVTAQGAEGSTSRAYGIYLDCGGSLTNTGVIRVSGDDAAHETYVGGSTTLLDTYNVTLDGDPGNAAFYVADNASLALNDATLTVTAVDGETLWDTAYELFEIEGTGAVTGSFGSVEAIHPGTTAVYDTQGTTEASDDTVSLSYNPGSSEPAASAAVSQHLVARSIDIVNRHLTNTVLQSIFSGGTPGLLADAGPVGRSVALANSDRRSTGELFIEPYYSTMEHDANPMGFDADLWGLAAGYERQMDNTLIGLHVGYGQADVDYTGAGYSANSEDQDILTGGLSGLTRWDEWTLRYGLTGFYGWSNYRGLTGLSLDETEKGSTDSYGAMASVMAGHIFRRGAHVLLPEVGVNWLWGHRQRYTTEASDPAWDTTYSAMNDHDLYAEASLNWLCGFMYGDMHVTPAASIGVRHLLTDADSSVTQSLAGAAPVTVDSQRDRTALTLAGSVTLTKQPHSLSLAYDGEYSPDTQRHSLWLRYAWQF